MGWRPQRKLASSIRISSSWISIWPRCNGLEATRLIKIEMPQTKIIILTASDDEYIFEAMESGADGFLPKLCRTEELVTLLSAVVK